MTLDEAREVLGVVRGADVAEIRTAFRRRARELHPDRHPTVDSTRRRQLGREFDRAREAHDILVRFTSDPVRVGTSSSANFEAPRSSESTRPSARPFVNTPSPSTSAPPPRRERARPRTSESRPRPEAPPRVTIRFDEFVRAADAAGFGPGPRTRRWIDWPRIVAWSVVGALVLLIAGGGVATAYLL